MSFETGDIVCVRSTNAGVFGSGDGDGYGYGSGYVSGDGDGDG